MAKYTNLTQWIREAYLKFSPKNTQDETKDSLWRRGWISSVTN
jgi:hypothetical protein